MRHRHPSNPARFRRGFTLLEIMIVVAIIVLMVGMAVPVFHTITGSRSEEGARNQIAAMLGRARADAIGLNQNVGVAFAYNPSTHLSYMAEVWLVPTQPFATSIPLADKTGCYLYSGGYTYYYFNGSGNVVTMGISPSLTPGLSAVGGPPLDMRPDTDIYPLPTGVCVQTICNTFYSGGIRQADGFLSVGVILFDGKGRISSSNYGISKTSNLLTSAGIGYGNDYPIVSSSPGNQVTVMSQFGLVIFNKDQFTGQGFTGADAVYSAANSGQVNSQYTAGTPSQLQEEQWLDVNATPLLIDRFTGELIRTE